MTNNDLMCCLPINTEAFQKRNSQIFNLSERPMVFPFQKDCRPLRMYRTDSCLDNGPPSKIQKHCIRTYIESLNSVLLQSTIIKDNAYLHNPHQKKTSMQELTQLTPCVSIARCLMGFPSLVGKTLVTEG